MKYANNNWVVIMKWYTVFNLVYCVEKRWICLMGMILCNFTGRLVTIWLQSRKVWEDLNEIVQKCTRKFPCQKGRKYEKCNMNCRYGSRMPFPRSMIRFSLRQIFGIPLPSTMKTIDNNQSTEMKCFVRNASSTFLFNSMQIPIQIFPSGFRLLIFRYFSQFY